MPSEDPKPAGHGHVFDHIPIYNSQNVHLGDNHLYNEQHGLDQNRLAAVLLKRRQSINRQSYPNLNDERKRPQEAQTIHIDYKLPPHIKWNFPALSNLTPHFWTSHEGETSLTRHLINKLRIKNISDPLDNLIGDCLKERLDKIRDDLVEVQRRFIGNARNQFKQALDTAVGIAITKTHTAMLDLLLDSGANINGWGLHKNTLEETPLLFAIGTGNLAMVNGLIERGANVRMRCGPVDCPLKAAVLLNLPSITKALLSAGANILDTTGKYGNSMLAATSLVGSNDCLSLLLERLSDQELAESAVADAIMVALNCVNKAGALLLLDKARTLQGSSSVSLNVSGLLECAAYFDSTEAALLALASQADASASEFQTSLEIASAVGNFAVLDVLLQRGKVISSFLHPDQHAALSLAVRKRSIAFAYYFSKKGSHIYAQDNPSCALQFAARQGNLDFVKLLIQQGALKAWDSRSLIQLAMQTGHGDIAIFLINEGAQTESAAITAVLEYAAESGRLEIIQKLVQAGAIIRFPEHDRALEIAAHRGDIDITRFLVRKGINSRPGGRGNILETAARQGFLGIVRFLVRDGFAITGTTLGNAIESGNYKVVSFLLEEKPSILSQENKNKFLAMAVKRKYGRTTVLLTEHGPRSVSDYSPALEIAVDKGDIEIVKYLVSLGAPVTDELAEMAAERQHYDVTVFLFIQGAILRGKNSHLESAVRRQDWKWVRLLLEKEADSDFVSPSGQPLLNLAVLGGDTSIISLLLEHGAKPDHGHPNKKSSLALAVEKGSVDMVTLLIAKGANPNGFYSKERTVLAQSVNMRKGAIVSVLLEHGADPNPFQNPLLDRSPLEVAIRHGDASIVRTLLGKMHSLRGRYGSLSLNLAIERGDAGIARDLVNAGAELRMSSGQQSSSLRDAMVTGKFQMFKILREQGARFTLTDGAFVLARAVDANDESMAEECLNAGADPNHKYVTGSPLGIAAQNKNSRLIKLLLDRGANPNDNVLHSSSDCLRKALSVYPSARQTGTYSAADPVSQKGNAERCIKLLIEAGAKAEFLSEFDKKQVDRALAS